MKREDRRRRRKVSEIKFLRSLLSVSMRNKIRNYDVTKQLGTELMAEDTMNIRD
jgi:hypothetical protein